MQETERKLIQAVDALEDDILAFTSRLVAQDSTLGNEAGALAEVKSEFSRLGFEPTIVPIEVEALSSHPGFAPVPWDYQGRYNVVATRPPDASGGKSALFNGHLDVVSPEPLDHWTKDPFSPLVEDGWMYGRGAADMKSGVAAMIYALKAVENAGFGLAAPVTLETVIEEECTGNGALACRAAGYDAEAVLIPEPFGPVILTSQVGVCWFKVSLHGVSKHALETHLGVNAIEKCYPLFQALRGLEDELNRHPHPAFKHLDHPINLNIGTAKGGAWPSTVPAMAEFHCRLSFFPGMSFENISGQVEKTIKEASGADPWLASNPPQVEFYGFRSQGHSLKPDLPAFKILDGCHHALSGEHALEFASTSTTDLRSFVFYGQGQATCFGPVGENIHAEDERVEIGSILHTAKVYALFLARWCGLVE
ncbi:MAG: ArgE/DapE family deacylase [Desulfarculaceae bacterium]|jgi:acetylornithine deacetylase